MLRGGTHSRPICWRPEPKCASTFGARDEQARVSDRVLGQTQSWVPKPLRVSSSQASDP
jgi:hypothetical protein